MLVEMTIFSDYNQIFVLDSCSETDPSDYWMAAEHSAQDHLAVSPDTVSIQTGLNAYVAVVVEVTEGPPPEDRDAFDTISECSVRIASGELVVTSPTYGPDDSERVSVPAGWLRFRVSLLRDPFGDDVPNEQVDDPFEPDAWQRVRIQCWPAEPAAAALIQGWDTEAGVRVS